MSDRYTQRDAEAALERLALVCGKAVGHYRELRPGEASTYGSSTHTTNPGAWALDYNPIYGGCVIEEIADDGGTWVRHPFGDLRRSPREFVEAVRFAMDAIRVVSTATNAERQPA